MQGKPAGFALRSGKFDVIVLDALSGDSIPLHLLTTQAMKLYLYLLKPDGVLAFHISNRSQTAGCTDS